MTTVLVTGGSGRLGRLVVQALLDAGASVRVLSRREQAAGDPTGVDWRAADLTSDRPEDVAALAAACEGVDVIVHTAKGAGQAATAAVEVQGTARLLAAARTAAVGHIVYISIVGIETTPLPYYREKLTAERLVRESAVPWSILRATQFHDYVGQMIAELSRFSIAVYPAGASLQPVAVQEVAQRLSEMALAQPAGMAPDFGGPEVLAMGYLVRSWLRSRGMRRLVLPILLPGALGAAMRSGQQTCPDHRAGTQTWEEWLAESAPAHPATASSQPARSRT